MQNFFSSDSFSKLRPIVSFKGYFNYNLNFVNDIPLHETIDITINLIFNHNPTLNITKKELKKLFFLATSQTHFSFNSKFYNQIL